MNYLEEKIKEIRETDPSREKLFRQYAGLIEELKEKLKKKKMPNGKKMSGRVFAELVGVSHVMVFNWFKLRNIISLEKYLKALEVLK